MGTFALRRFVLTISAALLAACGGSQPPIGAALSQSLQPLSNVDQHAAHRIRKNAQVEALLHQFAVPPDGEEPVGTLLNVGGTLYGTTSIGGTSNDGTVFSMTTSGTYNRLYSFAGGSDGVNPSGRLVDVGGTLYGTTSSGGTSNDGTVFSMTTSGAEAVIHTFSGADGATPKAGLISVNGRLYGVTSSGGANGDGAVFKMTTSGAENILHSFAGSDGANPDAELLKVGADFYATTYGGGANGDGTVFKMTLSGAETVLHSFAGSDGTDPYDSGGLIGISSALYGTTVGGGASNDGTIFKITTAGSFTNLYSFQGNPNDGDHPYAGVTNVNGTPFGATESGGGTTSCEGGCGVIYALLQNGPEIVVYRFAGIPNDGGFPYGGLINVGGTLYGTTQGGGYTGLGTIFSLSL